MSETNFKYNLFCAALYCLLSFTACDKYLAEPSDKSFAVITNLDDVQALLDNFNLMNNSSPNAHEVSSDDYFLTDEGWESLSAEEDRRMYIWADEDVFRQGDQINDWYRVYRAIFYANIVLESLEDINIHEGNKQRWRNIKGQALTFRASSFLDAVQVWSLAYDSATAEVDKGIPLRLHSDFNIVSTRGSLQETYNQIIADLKEAALLLPTLPIAKTRPSQSAAYGLLARTYLWLRDYPAAKRYADSCLMISHDLMDYNQLDMDINYPIPRHNVEVIFEKVSGTGQVLSTSRLNIPFNIYNSFVDGDLRGNAFFYEGSEGQIGFKGHYYGGAAIFTGLATNEIYLIRAECLARAGDLDGALKDLNRLLETRWKQNEFTPLTAASIADLLALILAERRKELLFRGLRWADVKRLNKEEANISLVRMVNGQTYKLTANSARFALPLPADLQRYFD